MGELIKFTITIYGFFLWVIGSLVAAKHLAVSLIVHELTLAEC